MPERDYQICTRCVMDTTDPDITFDKNGVCSHCQTYETMVQESVLTGNEGTQRAMKIINEIKKSGAKKEYDCIIGVSGGVDSTYVAYKVKEFGLRPLAVHLDNGWDSELAVKNIENVLKILNIDLYTHVIDWEEFKDLQLAFLKASVPDAEIPSDHAIFVLMYQMAAKIDSRYVITGINTRTESHLPLAWSQGHLDWKYIRSIHKQFGKTALKSYPHVNLLSYWYYRFRLKLVNILDYLDYVKNDAKKLLKTQLCWKDYGWKHHESIYTRFYQGYILPKKFGYDKRKCHHSSLICSGEISRKDALKDLQNEPYSVEMQEEDRTYVIKKLGLNNEQFDAIMNLPQKTYWDYPNNGLLYEHPAYKIARNIFKSFMR